MARARRDKSPLTLVRIDIDDFAIFNQRFGRMLGDNVLQAIARTLQANLRGGDFVARYDGDEFMLLLPDTPKLEASHLADRLRFAIAACAPERRDGDPNGALTVSIGLSTSPADAKKETALIAAAGHALKEAKLSGKDQVRPFKGSTRSYARCKAKWNGHVRALEPIAQRVQTIELGENGVLFRSDVDLPNDALLEVVLSAPTGDEIRVTGRVAWARRAPDGSYHVAVRALDGRDRHAEQLARWVAAIENGEQPAKHH
jgi:diguanylate cyclase (GGDEF)-like protein